MPRYGTEYGPWRRLSYRDDSDTVTDTTATVELQPGEAVNSIRVRGSWDYGITWSLEMETSGGNSSGRLGGRREEGDLRLSPQMAGVSLAYLSGWEGQKDIYGVCPDWVTVFHWVRRD